MTVPTAPQRVDQGLQILLSSPLCSSQSANIPTRFHHQPHPLLYKSADRRNLVDLAPRNPNETLYGPGDNDTATAGSNSNPYRSRLPDWNY